MTSIVKPLEWVEFEENRGDGTFEPSGDFESESQIGTYTVEMGWGSDSYYWDVMLSAVIVCTKDDPDAAKAAAQADYEARILSALTADPRAMVAAALQAVVKYNRDRAKETAGMGSVSPDMLHLHVADHVKSMIDTDHADALEAVKSEAYRRGQEDAANAFHDEQVRVWAQEILEALALTGVMKVESYHDKVEAFCAVTDELKSISAAIRARGGDSDG